MALVCLKTLASEDPPGQFSSLCSESRFAFTTALAKVLAAMASPQAAANPERPKKKPAVSDFSSAVDFLEQAIAKGPSTGAVFVGFRSAVSLAATMLAEAQGVSDAASFALVVRCLMNALDLPAAPKGSRSISPSDDESLIQVGRQISIALQRLLNLAEKEGCLIDFVEQGLMPVVSAQFNETSRSTDLRMIVALGILSSACVASGESFRSLESRVTKPLLHLVGNYPSSAVQLHAAYCLRCVAHGSPPQLFQLMSVLLNLTTVQNAEVLGTPLRRREANGQMASGNAAGAAAVAQDTLQPLVRGLFGHCAALAALSGELYCSELGVPHDVTSAVLGTSKALLQPHPSSAVSAQRRSCAFLLLEGLMCLGSDWVGQRLTTLFALWKTALGKKPVDRAKVLYQEHVAAGSPEGAADTGSSACKDELLSLLFALRSLYAFTWHSRDTLLVSLPHLHKILVVFLTNISQLVVALPHPSSATLRAKYRQEASHPGAARPIIAMSSHCGIPEILMMIRAAMYRTFATMQPSHFASRFVPLLNMLADDVTRALPADFPVTELLAQSLHRNDVVLDLVDSHLESSRECCSTTRLSVSRLLSPPSIGSGSAATSDRLPSSEDLSTDAGAAIVFSSLPKESPGGSECVLTPWDAFVDSTRPLAGQCISPEWDWRSSSIKLLAIIMNAAEVGESPRTAVLLHLMKGRKDSTDEGSTAEKGRQGAASGTVTVQSELYAPSSLAILAYIREHIRVRGLKVAPPAQPVEQVMQIALAGLKEANPALRRVHVEILSLLFFAHHQLPESQVVPTILQHMSTDPGSASSDAQSQAERLRERSGLALLCGAVLRAFAWGWKVLSPMPGANPSRPFHCPYIMNIVPTLLKLAKETAQPVRLWMLYSLHLGLEAAGVAFAPFLKDALRLGTAHLLADFFESPLMLWVVSELTHSAAATLSKSDGADMDFREENSSRLLGIWKVFRHVSYGQPWVGNAFATVRAEVVSMSTTEHIAGLLPLRDLMGLASKKLGSTGDSSKQEASEVCVVRTFAARCLKQLALLQGRDVDERLFKERPLLFALLNASQGAEAEALQELILAMLRQRGLEELPAWLQVLKETILALPAKGSAGASKEEPPATPSGRRGSDDRNADEVDDEASFADQKPEESATISRPRSTRVATKVFAVSCLQLLLEQANPEDADHFQPETSDVPAVRSAELRPEKRLVTHLESLVSVAVNAASSDEVSLALAGLRLMLLVVRRFQHTKDIHAQIEGMPCPLLLTQFEAQLTTCIRHNLRAVANPFVTRLALELLRDIISIRACNSTQRLIGLLIQPLSSQVFEPDPLFCEAASTGAFLFRLSCACAVLDAGQPQERAVVASSSQDLARWIENALRDGAVLLAGLPLQNVKTYQPACFNLADYKTVQPLFREALPSLLQGICALCETAPPQPQSPSSGSRPSSPKAASGSSWVLGKDLASLSLGIIVLLLGVQDAEPSPTDLGVLIRAIRHILTISAASGKEATVSLSCFLDVMECVWRDVFCIPRRCLASLPRVLELIHAISGALWRGRTPGSSSTDPLSEVAAERVAELPWLDGLCADGVEGGKSRNAVSAYALHVVAASLRCPEVTEDAGRTSMALEVLTWWLSDSLPRSLEGASGEIGEGVEEDLMAAALESGAGFASEERGASATAGLPRFWFWLLFLSAFPESLIHRQPAVTLKYWKMVCNLLSSMPACAEQSSAGSSQLLYLALLVNKMCESLLVILEPGRSAQISEAAEREIIYSFATLVPAVTALATVLRESKGGKPGPQAKNEEPLASDEDEEPVAPDMAVDNATTSAQRCLERLKKVFESSFCHANGKVAQTAVSSAQNLLQNPSCSELCPLILPCLLSSIASEPPKMPSASLDAAWSVLSAMLGAQHQAGCQEAVRATTQLVLRLVGTLADFQQQQPGSALAASCQTAAMARCLMQVAQIDQAGLKAEVAAMPSESQLTIQQLLREHMSSAGRADSAATASASGGSKAAAPKIELKINF
eukprot:TRINITY_DN27174_c0_g1_i1.p1 TRINITY_DN27174_c0_g1~~TRINITY_DN27174_c0_g1_i1.p1  ORF type:complete len:2249 (+),score=465.66 TRINITY_DN27174_c0_g1_i1:722-6748(+)